MGPIYRFLQPHFPIKEGYKTLGWTLMVGKFIYVPISLVMVFIVKSQNIQIGYIFELFLQQQKHSQGDICMVCILLCTVVKLLFC